MDVNKPMESLMELADIEATRRLTDVEFRLKRNFFTLAVLKGVFAKLFAKKNL